MKELPYFKHFASEYLASDIVFEDLEIQGAYIFTLSIYWNRDCDIDISTLTNRLKRVTQNPESVIQKLVDCKILSLQNEKIVIQTLDEQKSELLERRDRQVAGGRITSEKRSKQDANHDGEHTVIRKDKIRKDTNTWRNDFNLYLTECKQAYLNYLQDLDVIKIQESLNPNVNVRLSIQKGYVNYWGTEAGWKKKRASRSIDIDWKSTITNSIGINKVYFTKEELQQRAND